MKFNKSKIEKALKYLKKDIYDDFWPDIISYEDILDEEAIGKIDFDNYVSNPQLILDIPKPTLILRPGHYLDLKDRFYYQLLINEFAKKVDSKLLGNNIVFAHRIKDSRGYLFGDGINSWKW